MLLIYTQHQRRNNNLFIIRLFVQANNYSDLHIMLQFQFRIQCWCWEQLNKFEYDSISYQCDLIPRASRPSIAGYAQRLRLLNYQCWHRHKYSIRLTSALERMPLDSVRDTLASYDRRPPILPSCMHCYRLDSVMRLQCDVFVVWNAAVWYRNRNDRDETAG